MGVEGKLHHQRGGHDVVNRGWEPAERICFSQDALGLRTNLGVLLLCQGAVVGLPQDFSLLLRYQLR